MIEQVPLLCYVHIMAEASDNLNSSVYTDFSSSARSTAPQHSTVPVM